jgi:hypothetical protein
MKRGFLRQGLGIVCLWVVVAGIAVRAQADTPALTDAQMKAAAVEQANEYTDAYMHGDYDSLAIKTSQTMMDLQGGSQAMSMTIENKKSELSGQGIATNSIAIGAPSQIVKSGSTLFAVVPSKISLTVPKGTATRRSYLLGTSDDGGHTWKFIDGADMDKYGDKVRTAIADFPKDLQLPASQPMTLDPSPTALSTGDSPTTGIEMEVLERRSYKMNVPVGSSYPPASMLIKDTYGVSENNLTAISVPSGEIVGVAVTSRREGLSEYVKKSPRESNPDVSDFSQRDTNIFDDRGGSGVIFEYTKDGTRYFAILGQVTSDEQGYLISADGLIENENAFIPLFRKMVNSLQFKE